MLRCPPDINQDEQAAGRPSQVGSGLRLPRLFAALAVVQLLGCPSSDPVRAKPGPGAKKPLPACQFCGADEAPAKLSWDITIAGKGEPGQRLVLDGTVYRPDGKTVAPGVLLYAYHTNEKGVYPKRGNETGNARRHGYLRGWLRTNDQGKYRIRTIYPGSYPTRTEPSHVHITVKEPGKPEYYIDSVMFAGDPLIPSVRKRLTGRGGNGVVKARRNARGNWRATRDIKLLGPPVTP